MSELLALLCGAVLGGLVAWLAATSRARARFSAQAAEGESRASAAEGVLAEVRGQLEKGQADLSAVRASLDHERQARVKAETQLEEALRNVAEQRRLLDEARQKLADTFKALSDDALKSNNQAFLDLARRTLDVLVSEAKGELGKRQEAIDGLVKPLNESLKQYQGLLREIEAKRQSAYSSLNEQIGMLAQAHRDLRKETGDLVTALRRPQVRGQWGEMTLRRVVELAGMSEHCDFTEQVSVATEGGRLRPDLIVHLPGEREIVVDSKVPLEAYLSAVSAETEEDRKQHLRRHAQQTRTHMEHLAGKAYWEQFRRAPDLVVMFIPAESFFSTALEQDAGLLEDGMRRRVVLATPTTLIALLRAVAYGWRQEQIARNAQAISDLGRDLYERLRSMAEHLGAMGKGLAKANESFNKAVGSLESRVFPAARRFKDMGVAATTDIPEVQQVEVTPRMLDAAEADRAPDDAAGPESRAQ